MPFVRRDQEGKIVAVSIESESDQDEELSASDSELIGFYTQGLEGDNPLSFLFKSDLEVTRVLEDLIDLLIARGIINFTDLPESAQTKLMGRRKARANLQHGEIGGVLVDDEILNL